MRMTPRRLAIGMTLWIPNLFSGIRVKRFSPDWTSATVELHVNAFTRNYVKTAFGGSMSAMTDPYFFMLVRHQLGRDHIVWDTRGEIAGRCTSARSAARHPRTDRHAARLAASVQRTTS
ncbi:DUF4442 domain-containing protein [Agromyces sp. H66]|uniref:DUF4442 domain-containing protein n=1 Tax=Agromyces sp. H66 TaxID=2529859 RepID=UPI0020BD48DC|nr:DUF4442 domain-containing protein [Agromyces sp. H66]